MARCFCSNIMIMQLFYELKQQFPAIPDSVLAQSVEKNGHNKELCELDLQEQNSKYLVRSFPVDIVDKMTSDNRCKEFFKRHHSGRQSLDSSIKSSLEQKRQTWRCRKSEPTSKSEENLSESNISVGEVRKNSSRLSNLSNSFEKVNSRLPRTDDRFFKKRSESCDNINHERTSVKVMSYPGPPKSFSAPLDYHSYIPVAVDITTERPNPFVQKTALTVEPVSLTSDLHSYKGSRPMTSVNLTLRPPSTVPQSPIDIAMRGSSVTYSTFSTDPKLGYQSQLEINFRPTGQSSITATRLKPHLMPVSCSNPSLQLVMSEQVRRKQKLEDALHLDLLRLQRIEEEIERLKQYLTLKQHIPRKLMQVKEDIVFLRGECAKWTMEVDLAGNEQVPLGETNEDFYKDIYQDSGSSGGRNQGNTQSTEEVGWACHMCTFINYPILPKCEQCEMPRLDFKTSITAATSSRNPHPTAIRSNALPEKCLL